MRLVNSQAWRVDSLFDLTYRPRAGEELHYTVSASYRNHGTRGLIASIETYTGEMRRAVRELADSSVRETITWHNVSHLTADHLERCGKRELIAWADGFTYEYDSTQGIADLLRRTEQFPRDLEGWNVLLLMIDAHVEFDVPRTVSAGITELRHVGDRVSSERREEFVISFAPYMTARFPAGEWTDAEFVGLSLAKGTPCAVVSSSSRARIPFEVESPGGAVAASTGLRRELSIRPKDGVLEEGLSVEWVCVGDRWINPVYEIERVEPDPAANP